MPETTQEITQRHAQLARKWYILVDIDLPFQMCQQIYVKLNSQRVKKSESSSDTNNPLSKQVFLSICGHKNSVEGDSMDLIAVSES